MTAQYRTRLMAHTQLKKTGNFEAFVESVKATAVLGGSVWKFIIELPDGSGEGYVSNGQLIYLKVGDLKGEEALKHIKRYDRFSWDVEIFTGTVPELHTIDIASVYLEELSPKIPFPKLEIIDGGFAEVLKNLESSKFTGMVIHEDYIAIFKDGSICGIRNFLRLGRTSEILENLRDKNGRFYLIEFAPVEKVAGFIYGLRDITDSPAGQWDAKKVREVNGTVEISRGLNRILIISDGREVLTILGLSTPPTFSENITQIFLRGNLISTYPSTAVKPIFKYTFSDAEEALKLFSELVNSSRKFLGEIIFQKASQKAFNYSLNKNPYPDEVVETLASQYKNFEKEISVFVGKHWKQERERILSQYPEYLSKLFNVSKPS